MTGFGICRVCGSPLRIMNINHRGVPYCPNKNCSSNRKEAEPWQDILSSVKNCDRTDGIGWEAKPK